MLGFTRHRWQYLEMSKIGCQSALYLRERFSLEGTANVIGIDKPAAMCNRKVTGIQVEQCRNNAIKMTDVNCRTLSHKMASRQSLSRHKPSALNATVHKICLTPQCSTINTILYTLWLWSKKFSIILSQSIRQNGRWWCFKRAVCVILPITLFQPESAYWYNFVMLCL